MPEKKSEKTGSLFRRPFCIAFMFVLFEYSLPKGGGVSDFHPFFAQATGKRRGQTRQRARILPPNLCEKPDRRLTFLRAESIIAVGRKTR